MTLAFMPSRAFGNLPDRSHYDCAETFLRLRGISRDALFPPPRTEGGRTGLAGIKPSKVARGRGNAECGTRNAESPESEGEVGDFPLPVRRAESHRHVRHEARGAGRHPRLAQAGLEEGGRHHDQRAFLPPASREGAT